MSNANNNLSLFNFQDHNIRVVILNGEPWFVAKDVCDVLSLANHHQVIVVLSEHQKLGVHISDPHGREQITTVISEAALYKLAFRSKKEEAEVFTDWVASVVLPSIRKTGRYSLMQEEPQKPDDQLSQWLNWDPTLLRTLSREEYMCLIQYERTRLNFLVTIYNSKYPHTPDNTYPREDHRLHQTGTLIQHPIEGIPDLQTILLDYLHKTESVTVRYLQQSGPRQLRNLPAEQLRTMLQTLVENGVLKIVQMGKAEHYQLA